jgi:hypothetical protein
MKKYYTKIGVLYAAIKIEEDEYEITSLFKIPCSMFIIQKEYQIMNKE